MVCSDCSYVLFEPRESQQRPFNTMSAALICKKFSRNPSKFHFPWKQNLSSRQKALKPETLLTLKVSQYRKSGSTSSGSEPVAASSDCCWLGIRIYKIKIQKIAPWVKELLIQVGLPPIFCNFQNSLLLPIVSAWGQDCSAAAKLKVPTTETCC